MRSTTILTYELDDIDAACNELCEALGQQLPLGSCSAGLLLCDPDVDHAALMALLQQRLSFPVVGGSFIGVLAEDGFHDFCASLTVLTADDCNFAVSVSAPVQAKNAPALIADAYQQLAARLPAAPQLVLTLPPNLTDVPLDLFTEGLNQAAGGVPLFGGVASSNPPDYFDAVYADGQVYTDRLVLLGISGSIPPVFSSKNKVGVLSELKRTVTEARDSVVHRVGDKTMTQYLQRLGVIGEEEEGGDLTFTFGSNPLLIEPKDNSPAYMRSIRSLDMKAGSATTIGRVPEGATICVGAMDKSDISVSAHACVEELQEKMRRQAAEGYQFSTVLCATCVGRFMITAPNGTMEGDIISETIGQNLTVSGFYGNGEICPVAQGSEELVNRFHTHSINLCAF